MRGENRRLAPNTSSSKNTNTRRVYFSLTYFLSSPVPLSLGSLVSLSAKSQPLRYPVPACMILSEGFHSTIELNEAYAEVCRETQPSKIWCQTPRSNFVYLTPDVCQIRSCPSQQYNICRGFNGPLEPEEKWHVREIQSKLDGVESGPMLETVGSCQCT